MYCLLRISLVILIPHVRRNRLDLISLPAPLYYPAQLTSSLIEVYQSLSPLLEEANSLTAAVSEHAQFLRALHNFVNRGASRNVERTEGATEN